MHACMHASFISVNVKLNCLGLGRHITFIQEVVFSIAWGHRFLDVPYRFFLFIIILCFSRENTKSSNMCVEHSYIKQVSAMLKLACTCAYVYENPSATETDSMALTLRPNTRWTCAPKLGRAPLELETKPKKVPSEKTRRNPRPKEHEVCESHGEHTFTQENVITSNKVLRAVVMHNCHLYPPRKARTPA